jgi:hypothetical protein
VGKRSRVWIFFILSFCSFQSQSGPSDSKPVDDSGDRASRHFFVCWLPAGSPVAVWHGRSLICAFKRLSRWNGSSLFATLTPTNGTFDRAFLPAIGTVRPDQAMLLFGSSFLH